MGRTSKKVNPLGTFTKRLAREPLLAAVHSAWSTLDEAGQEASSEASALELLSGTTVRSNALRVCATVAPRGLTPVPELGSSGLPLAWSSRASDAHRSTSCRTPPRTRCITPRAQLHRREASTLHIRKCPSLAPRQRSCGGALHTSDASVAPPPAVACSSAMAALPDSAARRLQVMAGHLAAGGRREQQHSVARQATAAPSDTLYASATGSPSSYAKVRLCCACWMPAMRAFALLIANYRRAVSLPRRRCTGACRPSPPCG